MSDTYYTCDYCLENGNDEVSCHREFELAVYSGKVVCDGCRECGEFPELEDDSVFSEFVPPEKQRIAMLEAALWKLAGVAARLEFGEHEHIDRLQRATYVEALQEQCE
jgi:hypothetical protein